MQRHTRARTLLSRVRLSARLATLLAVLMGAGILLGAHADAQARPRPRSNSFTANKTFGLGLMFGEPTGLSGKYFFGPDTAFDFGLGYIPGFRGRDGVHLHGDFLWHPASLVNAQPFSVPLYLGIGARFFDFDDDNDGFNDDTVVGMRVPFGLALDFNNIPLDIFFDLAFVLDFCVDDFCGDDDIRSDFNFALGFRYYIN